ncbi:DNA gyrase inhibitor YacG [Devosia oryziradicis]|uniref:DNA gyrase inhibitor YacG n=1 Tax=Devosia oryziradicis TaxID=2801335 RepID=A0ABX7BVX8_9HYPH|nr:DNA gyrase inhibitor YacG [Devosia oryziradicis]QQR35946.1 DNA gyrase inhibitor YacG [Devosia oryziradicis]
MPAAKTCPICGKPSVEAFKPFCSKRCADVDLNRWLSGTYVIPAKEDEPAAHENTPVSGDDDEF